MAKGNINPILLFVGTCALGAAIFAGGMELRGRTDALSRVSRTSGGEVAGPAPLGPQIPLGDFYVAMTDLLKQYYVEPITDDQKLASGAVRGMILSLGDPRCAFMDADEFRAFLNAREGRYSGIGVELDYRGSATPPKRVVPGTAEPVEDPREAVLVSRVPYLVATMVVPGGPADRAGVKPGDVVSEIDGHWIPDAAEIARFDKAVKDFRDHKVPYAAVAKLKKSLSDKIERSLLPMKAKDRLILGKSGAVSVVWTRGGTRRTTKIARGESEVTPFGIKGGAIVMRFDTEAPLRLRTAIKDKTSVTLDLRNNVDGDFDSMRGVLAVLAPSGDYGAISTKRKESAMRLVVTKGNPQPPKLTILVDGTTRGPAAILARALASRHRATLVGGPTGEDLSVREVVGLPDGTGYTLVTGEYRPGAGPTKVALKENSL